MTGGRSGGSGRGGRGGGPRGGGRPGGRTGGRAAGAPRRYASAAPETVELRIDGLGSGGEGVGRTDGIVAFVPLAAPGDLVRARVVERKKRFLRAALVEVVEPGPDRVAPPCPVFGECGGCDWQHLGYAAQLRAKRASLVETLARVGGVADPPVAEIVPSEASLGYRDRIRGTVRGGRFHLARRGTGEPVAIERCEIADEAINARLADGFEGDAEGRVELAVRDGGVELLPVDGARATDLGFRQVNPGVARALEARLVADVAGAGAPVVHDLYCGAGTWTLPIAAACPEARTIGVESHAGSVEIARRRAREAGLAVEFRHGRVERLMKGLELAGSTCIVDPPRAGLDPAALARLVATPAATLAYVSCHPGTLARDLAALTEAYELVEVRPFDMFPQTAHLECRALLRGR